MKYKEYRFYIEPMLEDAADVLAAMLGECGFETFVPADGGMAGYVQEANADDDEVAAVVETVKGMMEVAITYSCTRAQDENFNATWEAEGFKPIVIGDSVSVHSTLHTDVPQCRYDIKINPCMAFGTGSHATTRMLLAWLAEHDVCGAYVVDAGCGTGILGILALMRGAAHVLAYDIDEWSVENTRSNMSQNGVTGRVLLGDSSVLAGSEGTATLLMANINRNILLADMERFAMTLCHGGRLLTSGFYDTDAESLVECAGKHGLRKVYGRSVEDRWTMIEFVKE